MSLWESVCSVPTRTVKFPGTCFKSKQWGFFICLNLQLIWVFYISFDKF